MSKIKKVLLASIIILVVVGIYLIFRSKEEVLEIKEIDEGKYYKINILYPVTKNMKVNKKIINLVESEKENLIIKSNERKDKNKYELIIDYKENEYKDVTFVNLVIYKYMGEKYERVDKSYYFNSREILEMDDFFYEDYLDKLSVICYHHIKEYLIINKNIDLLDEVIKITSKDLENFYLNDDGIKMVFNFYDKKLKDFSEINITIPYEEVNHLLKDKYKSVTKKVENVYYEKPVTNIEGLKDKKLIALTFDDGPSLNTDILLDGLKKTNSHVTFFVVGNKVFNYKNEIIRAHKEGHQIGNHTYSHLNLKYLSKEKVLTEVNYTNNAVEDLIGIRPTVLRPPYGSIKESEKKLINMRIVLWDVDTKDWKYRSSNQVYNKIIKNARDKNIILMHDVYKSTVNGCLKAIDELVEKGYKFVTVDELLNVKEIESEDNRSIFIN